MASQPTNQSAVAATTTASNGPPMIEVGSPAFQAVVADAVKAALALMAPAPAADTRTVAVQSPAVIPMTSLDQTAAGLDDLTVRFTRFCQFQNAGYQKGQEAGFPRAAAEDLHRGGSAFITHDPRRASRAA